MELHGREMADEFCLKMPDFHVTFRDLLHAVNLRHGTDGFTSLPKEGVLRIFSPWKTQGLRSGLNPRTWVPKASTLPLDHRSRMEKSYLSSWQSFSYSGKFSFSMEPKGALLVHTSQLLEASLGEINAVHILTSYFLNDHFNPLNTKRRLLYLKIQFVPRSKHFSSRL